LFVKKEVINLLKIVNSKKKTKNRFERKYFLPISRKDRKEQERIGKTLNNPVYPKRTSSQVIFKQIDLTFIDRKS